MMRKTPDNRDVAIHGTRLILPPRVYLDTNHLIEITRLRKGRACRDAGSYGTINRWLGDGTCTLIFSRASCLDWLAGDATVQDGDEIAQVVDSAAVWLEMDADTFVYTSEVLAECHRVEPSLQVPDLAVLREKGHDQPALLVLAQGVPEFRNLYPDDYVLPNAVSRRSARKQVRDFHGFKQRQPEVAGSYRDWFNESQLKSQAMVAGSKLKGYTQTDKIEWIGRCLRMDAILRAYNPGINAESLLGRIDPDRCPALKLWFDAYWRRNRAGHKPSKGDADDWAYVHVVPYANFVLAERQLTSFLHSADSRLMEKVTDVPATFVDMVNAYLQR